MQSLEKCIAKNVSVIYCKWKAMEAGLVTQILSLITGTEQKTWNAGMSISGYQTRMYHLSTLTEVHCSADILMPIIEAQLKKLKQ